MLIFTQTKNLIVDLTTVQGKDVTYCQVEKIDTNTFKLQMFVPTEGGQTLADEITINMRDYAANGAYEIIVLDNGFSPVFGYELIDASRVEMQRYLTYSPYYLSFTFYVPTDTGLDCLLMSRMPTFYTGIEPAVTTNKFQEIIKEKFPEFDLTLKKHAVKGDLLIKLDPNESLSYIEAQLDFVTKMLFAVVEGDPYMKQRVLEAVNEYSNVKDAFNQNNVFTVKDEHKCCLEILNGKKYVRDNQAAYFLQKAQLEGETNGI